MQPIQEISADLSQMLEEYVHHESKIKKGSLLYREGELATELFIIRSGKVQVSKLTQDGREFTLRLCSANDLIGEVSLACPNPKHKMNAKVLEDGKVAIIYMKDLENHLLTNNGLALEFMKWMSNQNEISQTKIRDLILNGKKGALYSTLIRLSNSYGTKTDDSSIIINHSLTKPGNCELLWDLQRSD